jgi:ACS family glucarate transporter-like MFS transporter
MRMTARVVKEEASSANSGAATRVRWRVVTLLGVITALTYVDRLNLGICGPFIQSEFHFDTQTMGWILSSFSLGYALFHIPGGWLGDRFGARGMLAFAVLWWSVFTAATAIAPNIPLLRFMGPAWAFACVRFLMGTGEAAAMPVGNKMMAYWFSDKERAFGTSIFLAGVGAGGLTAPLMISWIARHFGWRLSFFVCGALGFAVASVWYFYVRNRPEEHPGVNKAELALIQPGGSSSQDRDDSGKTPWLTILSDPSVWGVTISHFCLVYPVYIFFTWYFIYMVKVRGVTISKASFWASAPFLANAILVPMWGWLSDRAVAAWGKRKGRRATAWLAICLSAGLLWSGSHTANNTWSLLQLSIAAGFNFAASAMLWAVCNDITARFSGSVSGFMNTFGSLGGWLSPVLTAFIATRLGWSYALDFAAVVTLVSGAAWFLVRADQPLGQANANEH